VEHKRFPNTNHWLKQIAEIVSYAVSVTTVSDPGLKGGEHSVIPFPDRGAIGTEDEGEGGEDSWSEVHIAGWCLML